MGVVTHPLTINPRRLYRCPYCNDDLRLRESEAVVDSYANVCHLRCLDVARGEVHPEDRQECGRATP
jgi:hypothetical protein